jgi:ubiquinone/menaquinone biosynthesis C-methylase UbiE
VTQTGSDRDYWDERTRRYGVHAGGYRDREMDLYEDRLRMAAISRLLGAGRGRRLLDAGCGNGRWSVRLAQAGWIVTGVDFSTELIALARAAENVTYIAASIEDLGMPGATFDGWLSVTALQHITSDQAFVAALENLTRMTRPGGTAALLEYAPLMVLRRSAPHMKTRSRRQWIEAVESRGYSKRAETGVRFVGHVPFMVAVRIWSRLGGGTRSLRWLRAVCWALDLGLARIGGLTLMSPVRLIVFEKVTG